MRSAAVLALVLLAGCSVVAPGPQAETVTPAPVPTAEALPPGVEPDGVADPGALAAAHAATLDGTSFTLIANRTVRYPNGSLRSDLDVRLELSASRDYHASASVRGRTRRCSSANPRPGPSTGRTTRPTSVAR
ncbi:hypothetical protein ACFQL4_07495 [Halosimplex aquaticum]